MGFRGGGGLSDFLPAAPREPNLVGAIQAGVGIASQISQMQVRKESLELERNKIKSAKQLRTLDLLKFVSDPNTAKGAQSLGIKQLGAAFESQGINASEDLLSLMADDEVKGATFEFISGLSETTGEDFGTIQTFFNGVLKINRGNLFQTKKDLLGIYSQLKRTTPKQEGTRTTDQLLKTLEEARTGASKSGVKISDLEELTRDSSVAKIRSQQRDVDIRVAGNVAEEKIIKDLKATIATQEVAGRGQNVFLTEKEFPALTKVRNGLEQLTPKIITQARKVEMPKFLAKVEAANKSASMQIIKNTRENKKDDRRKIFRPRLAKIVEDLAIQGTQFDAAITFIDSNNPQSQRAVDTFVAGLRDILAAKTVRGFNQFNDDRQSKAGSLPLRILNSAKKFAFGTKSGTTKQQIKALLNQAKSIGLAGFASRVKTIEDGIIEFESEGFVPKEILQLRAGKRPSFSKPGLKRREEKQQRKFLKLKDDTYLRLGREHKFNSLDAKKRAELIEVIESQLNNRKLLPKELRLLEQGDK